MLNEKDGQFGNYVQQMQPKNQQLLVKQKINIIQVTKCNIMSQKFSLIFELFNKCLNLEEIQITGNKDLKSNEIIALAELAISLNKKRQKNEKSQSINYTKANNAL